jgi:threonine/homoserine/homoserine lactone efflux protein
MPMSQAASLFLTGAAFGATAGLSPGPLQTLVIAETLRYSLREGMKASLAPLVSDLPIILAAVLVLSKLAGFDAVMGVVSLCGAVFLCYLACGGLKSADAPLAAAAEPAVSLKKAVIANFLNPHPYIFWALVGAPSVIAACDRGVLGVFAFVAGFYLLLVGTLGLIAFGTEKSRRWVRGTAYRWGMRLLAGVMFFFAIGFFYKGIKLLAGGLVG